MLRPPVEPEVLQCLPWLPRSAPANSYQDLLELAEICAEQARAATAQDLAVELRYMAGEYGRRAARLVRGWQTGTKL